MTYAQTLASRVRHINSDGQQLLEQKKTAERRSRQLPLKCEIDHQCERNEQLQKCAARNHDPFAEKTKQQMTAFVNRNKNQIHQLDRRTAGGRAQQHDREKHSARSPSPRRKPDSTLPAKRSRNGKRSVSHSEIRTPLSSGLAANLGSRPFRRPLVCLRRPRPQLLFRRSRNLRRRNISDCRSDASR